MWLVCFGYETAVNFITFKTLFRFSVQRDNCSTNEMVEIDRNEVMWPQEPTGNEDMSIHVSFKQKAKNAIE